MIIVLAAWMIIDIKWSMIDELKEPPHTKDGWMCQASDEGIFLSDKLPN